MKNSDKLLILACGISGSLTKVKKCLNPIFFWNKPDINALNYHGESPLLRSVKARNREIAEYLLQHGAIITITDNSGNTALHHAAAIGSIDIVELLIKNDSNLNKMNKEGQTPFIKAIINDHNDIAELLINHGSSVDEKDSDGNTALTLASKRGHIRIVEALVQLKANINTINNDGMTPLMEACAKGHYEVSRFLVENNAALDINEKNGKTAIIIAAEKGHGKIVKLFLSHDIIVKKTIEQSASVLSDSLLVLNAYNYEDKISNIKTNVRILTCFDHDGVDRLRKIYINAYDGRGLFSVKWSSSQWADKALKPIDDMIKECGYELMIKEIHYCARESTVSEKHQWKDCLCQVCGKSKPRDVAGHSWGACRCKICGTINELLHDYDNCICRVCGNQKNELEDGHEWNGCLCLKCKRIRNVGHEFLTECKCNICGQFHTYKYVRTERHSYRDYDGEDVIYQCTNCGKIETKGETKW
jgi:ankyrin repeat protein